MKKKFFAVFVSVLCFASAAFASQASAEVAVARGMPVRLLGSVLEEIREPVNIDSCSGLPPRARSAGDRLAGTIRFYGDADFGFTHGYGPGFVVTDETGAVIEVGRVLEEGATKEKYERLRDSLASYRHEYNSGKTNAIGLTWGGSPDEDDEIDVAMNEETDGDRVVWSCRLSSGISEEVEVWRVTFDSKSGEIWASRVLNDDFAGHDSATEKIFALEDEPLRHVYDEQGNGSFVESDGWTREDATLSDGMTVRTYRRGGAVAQYLIEDGYIRKSRWRSRGFKSPVPGIGSGTPEADLFGRCALAEAKEGTAGSGLAASILASDRGDNAYWYQERHGGYFKLGVAALDAGRAGEFFSVFDDGSALPASDMAKMNELFEHSKER